MKNQTELSNFEMFKDRLSAEHENYKKQLEEVKEHYPLVALALALKDAARVELSPIGGVVDTPMLILSDALTGRVIRVMEMRPRDPISYPRWMQKLKEFWDCESKVPIGKNSMECLEKWLEAVDAELGID